MDTKILVVDDEPQLEYLFTQKFRRNIRNKEFEMTWELGMIISASPLAAVKG